MKTRGRIRSFMAVAAAASALGAAAAAPPVGAAAPGTVVATGLAQPARSDGAGTVALLLRSRVVRVLDVAAGTSRETALPQECALPSAGGDDGSTVVAVGGGKVLLGCATNTSAEGTTVRPLLLDIGDGAVQEVPNWPAAAVDQVNSSIGAALAGLGNGTVTYEIWGNKWRSSRQIDWRTGAISAVERPRLCAPLAYTRDPHHTEYDWSSPYFPLLYAQPYALTWGGDDRPLTLRRCGSTAATELQPLAPIPNHVSLTATGVVGWTETAHDGYTDAFTYLDSCRTRLRWPVRGGTALALTSGALFVSEPWDGGYRLRRIALACMPIGLARAATLSSGPRSAIGTPRSSVRRDPATGAEATLIPLAGAPRPLAVPRGATRLPLKLGGPAKTVRWRVGGRWRAAAGGGRAWTIALGPRRTARTLTVLVRGAGSQERHQWRLRLLDARR